MGIMGVSAITRPFRKVRSPRKNRNSPSPNPATSHTSMFPSGCIAKEPKNRPILSRSHAKGKPKHSGSEDHRGCRGRSSADRRGCGLRLLIRSVGATSDLEPGGPPYQVSGLGRNYPQLELGRFLRLMRISARGRPGFRGTRAPRSPVSFAQSSAQPRIVLQARVAQALLPVLQFFLSQPRVAVLLSLVPT